MDPTPYSPTDHALEKAIKEAGVTKEQGLANVVGLKKSVEYLVVVGGTSVDDLPVELITLRDPEPDCPVNTLTIKVSDCFRIMWLAGHRICQSLRSMELTVCKFWRSVWCCGREMGL